MKTDSEVAITLEDAVRSTPFERVQDYAACILDIHNAMELDPETLVPLVVSRIHADVWKEITIDLLGIPEDCETFFRKMLEGQSVRIPSEAVYAREFFDRVVFFNVKKEKYGRGMRWTATLPEEIRETINADLARYDDLRALDADLSFYADCAAVLYGVVTLADFVEIYKRWHPETRLTVELAETILVAEQFATEVEYFLHDDYVCHREFDAETSDETDDLISDFLKEVADKPRWYPDSEDQFLEFYNDAASLENDNARVFESFLKTHGVEKQKDCRDILLEVVSMHQFSERVSSIVRYVESKCRLAGQSDLAEMAGCLMNFLNGIHLRSNNGWTPATLLNNMAPSDMATPPTELLTSLAESNLRAAQKIPRNAPCPCGSGLKYKKCCGR